MLEEQDRALWDQTEVAVGLNWLEKSATGVTFSRYHAEAGIAAEHCLAPTLAATRWDRIIACYDLLDRVAPSAVHVLGRALAVAEWYGPEQGLAMVSELPPTAIFCVEGSAIRPVLVRALPRAAAMMMSSLARFSAATAS